MFTFTPKSSIKMVGTRCVVKYCPNIFKKTGNVSFHKIRADESLRHKWIHALETNNALRPGADLHQKTSRICGAHFTKDSFSLGINGNGSTKLLPKAVPSIFPKAPVPSNSEGPSSAKKRKYEGKFSHVVLSFCSKLQSLAEIRF